MNDRRGSQRRRTAAYHLVYERDTGEFIGRLTNLTTGGLQLITETAVTVASSFRCRLRLPDLFEGVREILFDIECRWCEYNRTGDWYESGYRFLHLNDLARSAIAIMIRDWPGETVRTKTHHA